MSFWSRLFAPTFCVAMGLLWESGLRSPGLVSSADCRKSSDGRTAIMRGFIRRWWPFTGEWMVASRNTRFFLLETVLYRAMRVTEVAARGINYGIGGDTTEGVLARLPEYNSLGRAAAVVLAIGDNDLQRGLSEAEIIANYGENPAATAGKNFGYGLFTDSVCARAKRRAAEFRDCEAQ